MFTTPGNEFNDLIVNQFLNNVRAQQPKGNQHSALVDENYIIVGVHLDKGIIERIINCQYVDFARLLPRDKITVEEDHRMELVNKGGVTFFVPVSDHENASITDFNKWEQAFRIYSNVYTRRFLAKAMELIQYNHIIFTASKSFIWDNVYRYDKEFRMYLSNFPNRSWSLILQQAWSICLKDRIRFNDNGQKFHANNGNNGQGKSKKEICKRFNRGKCTNGSSCRYNHRCLACGKWVHRAHICRKFPNFYNNNGTRNSENPSSAGMSQASNAATVK